VWLAQAGSEHATFLLSNYDFAKAKSIFPRLTRILSGASTRAGSASTTIMPRQPAVQLWPLHGVHQEYFGADLLVKNIERRKFFKRSVAGGWRLA